MLPSMRAQHNLGRALDTNIPHLQGPQHTGPQRSQRLRVQVLHYFHQAGTLDALQVTPGTCGQGPGNRLTPALPHREQAETCHTFPDHQEGCTQTETGWYGVSEPC